MLVLMLVLALCMRVTVGVSARASFGVSVMF